MKTAKRVGKSPTNPRAEMAPVKEKIVCKLIRDLNKACESSNAFYTVHTVETDIDRQVPVLFLKMLHTSALGELQRVESGDLVFVDDLFPSELWDALNDGGQTMVRACVHHMMREGALPLAFPGFGPDNHIMYSKS